MRERRKKQTEKVTHAKTRRRREPDFSALRTKDVFCLTFSASPITMVGFSVVLLLCWFNADWLCFLCLCLPSVSFAVLCCSGCLVMIDEQLLQMLSLPFPLLELSLSLEERRTNLRDVYWTLRAIAQ